MNDINKEILEKYLVRKSYKQKSSFIEFLKKNVLEMGYSFKEQRFRSLFLKGRNLIVGDPNKAKYLITAHYDTQATMGLLPNFCAPLNKSLSFLYQALLGLSLAAFAILIGFPIWYFTKNVVLGLFIMAFILMAFGILVIFGPANKKTYNDNTSGVTTLVDLMTRLKDDKPSNVCYIFFDLEEAGLIGSRLFLKTHKALVKRLTLINIDCVSDGTKMLGIYRNIKVNQIPKNDFIYASSKKAIYPSDQKGYPNYIAYTCLCESKRKNLYLSRIHTKRDVIYKEENINRLTDFLKDLVQKEDLELIEK